MLRENIKRMRACIGNCAMAWGRKKNKVPNRMVIKNKVVIQGTERVII